MELLSVTVLSIDLLERNVSGISVADVSRLIGPSPVEIVGETTRSVERIGIGWRIGDRLAKISSSQMPVESANLSVV